MLIIIKTVYLILAVALLDRCEVEARNAVKKSDSSFVTFKEQNSPEVTLLNFEKSKAATSYQYVQSSDGDHGGRNPPVSSQYNSKQSYTSSSDSRRRDQLRQQTSQSDSGQTNPSQRVYQSSTSFVEIKEGGSDDSALLHEVESKSATSYQYTSQSQSATSQRRHEQRPIRTQTGCSPCIVNGTSYRGHSRFEYTSGCYKKRCICNCDGSYTCPSEHVINICSVEQRKREHQRQAGSTVSKTRYSQSMGNRGAFSHQMAAGKRGQTAVFAKMEYVDTPDRQPDRQQDTNPVLESERQRQTEARRLEIERQKLAENRRSESSGSTCSPCIVNGTSYRGHSRFEYTSGCYKKRCICNCDGSYTCPSEHVINICSVEQRKRERQKQAGTRGCSPCVVNGTSYKGHSRFEYTSGCYKRRCICHCDGSHTCPSHHTINICKEPGRAGSQEARSACNTCSAKGKIVEGNSYFDLRDGCTEYKNCICRCNGSWSCSPDRVVNVCVSSQNESVCKECEVYGSFYPGNSKFKYEEGCYEYNCDCNCDGSWVCPPNRTKDICHTGCGECEVRGEFFEGNAYFKQERGCIEYTCFCRCNGSWTCPSDQARNICRSDNQPSCNQCHVSAHETYPGNSTFELRKGCIHYECTCNCDGSWDCPAQLAKNVCRAELPSRCVNCQVADNEFYPGDSDFEMRKGCFHYQCRCNCDGSWSCPAEKARDVCKGEEPGGCKICRLSETEYYRGETDFEMRRGCIHYRCHCNCDGSWNCPGEDARNVCLGEVPGGCRSCKVDNDTIYPGNSRFQLTRDCYRYDCVCRCNGSWSCPGHTGVYVCDSASNFTKQITCTDCILEGKSYKGGKKFELNRGCYNYQCKCSCDGRWTCDTNNAKNICSQPSTPPEQCKSCVVNGREYPGGSDFRIRRGCISYLCRCACDGRWECPSDRSSNFCPGSREPSQSCKPCTVDQKNYTVGEYFDMKRGCVRYRCRCRCDGSYGCHVTEDTACGAGELPAKCGNCVIDGYVYPGNMGFLTRNGCIQKACHCNCDGTYECPRDAIQNICTGEGAQSLRQSRSQVQTHRWNTGSSPYNTFAASSSYGAHLIPGAVPFYRNSGTYVYTASGGKVVSHGQYVPPVGPDGTQRIVANAGSQYYVPQHVPVLNWPGGGQYYYQGGRQFVPRRSGEFYTQIVHSQSRSVNNRKPFPPFPRSSQTSVGSAEYSANRGCRNCTIEGVTYQSNSDFKVTKKCIQYQCHCDCDGSWTCSGEYSWSCTPRNGPLSGDCRSCVVKDVEYPPNHKFTLQQGCSEYECQCNCDGKWFCPAQKPKDICGLNTPQNEQPSTCHKCVIRDTEYPSDSEFFLNEGCKQYTCTCLCDGSWVCPDSKTVDICNKKHKSVKKALQSKESEPKCKPCMVNGKSYMANKAFQFREGCSQYKCQCFCNGTWECPANDTVNICRSPDYRIDGCKSCTVNNETYPGGTAFRYREGCWEFNCFCACNGAWDCPPGRSTDLCKTKGGVSSRCRPCIINGKMIKSKSMFNMRHGCTEFLCDCKCDGSYECPPDRSLNVCEEGRLSIKAKEKSHFKGCKVGNRQFFTRLFMYTEDCIQYMCICYENGAWKCPPHKSKKVC